MVDGRDSTDPGSDTSTSNPSIAGTLVESEQASPTSPASDKFSRFECQYRQNSPFHHISRAISLFISSGIPPPPQNPDENQPDKEEYAGMSTSSPPYPLDLEGNHSPKEKNIEISPGSAPQFETAGKASLSQNYAPPGDLTSSTVHGQDGGEASSPRTDSGIPTAPLELLDLIEELTGQLFTRMEEQPNKQTHKAILERLSSDLEAISTLERALSAEEDTGHKSQDDQNNAT